MNKPSENQPTNRRLGARSHIQNPPRVTESEVRAIVISGRRPVIQFSSACYSDELLAEINQLCEEFGATLEVRFYGHYGSFFDATTLQKIPQVKSLSIDCLTEIRNESAISDLSHLTELSFGVYQFDCPNFLETLNVTRLTKLSLIENTRRNFDLAPLIKAQNLRTLSIHGHTRHIEVLRTLANLSELDLRSMPKQQSLGFLGSVNGLQSLRLILGGRPTLDFQHSSLQELDVLRVQGISDIGDLRRFPQLKTLHIEDQLQLRSIDLAGAPLSKIILANCKNLRKLNGLESLNTIAEIRISQTKINLDEWLDRDWPSSLKVLALYVGNRKWNEAARKHLDQRGFRETARSYS
jgi:protein phosphatase 1 regulatory subunit 7